MTAPLLAQADRLEAEGKVTVAGLVRKAAHADERMTVASTPEAVAYWRGCVDAYLDAAAALTAEERS